MADSGTGARKVKSGGGAGTKLTRKEVIALGGGNWSKGVGMINKGEVSASQVAAAQIKAGKVGTFGQDTTTRGDRNLVTKAMRSSPAKTTATKSTPKAKPAPKPRASSSRKTDLSRAKAAVDNPFGSADARRNAAINRIRSNRADAQRRIDGGSAMQRVRAESAAYNKAARKGRTRKASYAGNYIGEPADNRRISRELKRIRRRERRRAKRGS